MSDWSLDIQGKREIRNPSQQEIRTAIESMTLSDDPFLILQKGTDGWTYVQAILEGNSSWTLEYQEGSLERHYQVSNATTEQVTDIFLAFLGGNDVWRSSVSWERMDL